MMMRKRRWRDDGGSEYECTPYQVAEEPVVVGSCGGRSCRGRGKCMDEGISMMGEDGSSQEFGCGRNLKWLEGAEERASASDEGIARRSPMMAIAHVDQVGKVFQLVLINCSLFISRSARVPRFSFTELQSREISLLPQPSNGETIKQEGRSTASDKDTREESRIRAIGQARSYLGR